MSTPVSKLFQRPPRIYPDYPKAELELKPPSGLPSPPSMSRVQILLPLLMAVVTAVVLLSTVSTHGSANLGMNFMIVLFMGMTSLTAFMSFRDQKKQYAENIKRRTAVYETYLSKRQSALGALASQQRLESLKANPEPTMCVQRAEQLDRRFWERDASDEDFLLVRAGLGDAQWAVQVKPPAGEIDLDGDVLIERARQLSNSYAKVPNAPTCLPLATLGVLGIAGQPSEALSLLRALLVQIATHHSPADVKVVAIFSQANASRWDWLRFLPHAMSSDERFLLASNAQDAKRVLDSVQEVLSKRQIDTSPSSLDSRRVRHTPHYIIVLAEPSLYAHNPLFALLLKKQANLGATALVVATEVIDLPHECGGYIEFEGGEARLNVPFGRLSFRPDRVDSSDVQHFALAMRRVQLQDMGDQALIPTKVSLFELWQTESEAPIRTVDALNVWQRWQANLPFEGPSLAVAIGKIAGQQTLTLNLHDRPDAQLRNGQGAHGLVAGTSGAGKSEFLQTLIASLALNFSPEWVSFFLVDFKGGGMTGTVKGLPHIAGIVTDLGDASLAIRAMIALDSEVQRRKKLFDDVGVNYVDEYHKKYRLQKDSPTPLPSMPRLIIIVDEFAELASVHRDFLPKLYSISRVGRSLGIHLILATQKPAGTVNDQIWSNANFRVCFRVQTIGDSNEMLKRPEAVSLTRSGRAYIQVGLNEIFEQFQAGYGGGPYVHEGKHNQFLVEETQQKEIDVLVTHLHMVALRYEVEPVKQIWLPPLPSRVRLGGVNALPDGTDVGVVATAANWDGKGWNGNGQWLRPTVGLLDDPVRRVQEPLLLDFVKDGHLAVYGAGSSGKTTFLETLIVSLAREHSPADVALYLLDFGSRRLGLFEAMPQVGNVMFDDDDELVERFFRYFDQELRRRRDVFSEAMVNNLLGYKQYVAQSQTPQASMPAIFIIIDNLPAFAERYEAYFDKLAQLMRESAQIGIYVVFTALSPIIVRTKISGNVGAVITFELNDHTEYKVAVGRTDLQPAHLPGRGLVSLDRPLEFQAALPVGSGRETDGGRAHLIGDLAKAMADAWQGHALAHKIQRMPASILLSDLLASVPAPPDGTTDAVASDLSVPVGLIVESLLPLEAELNHGPHFLITGSTQSGKTTLLQTWLLGLALKCSPAALNIVVVDLNHSNLGAAVLAALPHCTNVIGDETELKNKLDALLQSKPGVPTVLAIDESDVLLRTGSPLINDIKTRLTELTRRKKGDGIHVILAATESNLGLDAWVKNLKDAQCGFVLGTSDSFNSINLRLTGSEKTRPVTTGYGFYMRRGLEKAIRFKVALAAESPRALDRLLETMPSRQHNG